MEPRIILQIRLSRRWVEGSPQTVNSLAYYLYSLYDFLGLSDPSAEFGWAIAQDKYSKAPYLLLIETPTGPDPMERAKPAPQQTPAKHPDQKEDNSDSALSPDELIPDL